MKSKFLNCCLLVCLLAFGYNAQGQDKLTNLYPDFNPSFPGGVSLSGGPQSEVITAAWTTLAVSTKPQSRTCCVYIANGGVEYIYQFGGGAGAELTSIARLNIGTGIWTLLGSTLNLAVSSGTAVADGDSVIYVFGGNSPTLGFTQKFNVNTGVTTTMAPMPTPVTDAAVVKYKDTLVYVIGGGTGLFATGYFNTVQLYRMRSNTYSAATVYPIAAGMMGFGIHGDTIICAGGWNGTTGVANAYKGIINPVTPTTITWTAIPNYPLGGVTRMASYFVRKGNGRGIMFTGGAILGATLTNRTYLWDICNDRWDSTVANSQARSNFKAAGRGDSVAWIVAGFTTVGVGTTERITFSQIDCGVGPIVNDVGVSAIVAPGIGATLFTCPSVKVAPKATIRNFGSANQFTPFPITYTITGPAAYTSTKLDTLSAGLSRTITFDSTFQANIPGIYNVKAWTSLPGDGNPANDTMVSTFTIINPHFGGGLPVNCNYFFANSTACASSAPSQPVFNWLDTSGGTSLVLNNVQQNAPAFTGTLDDGYWKLEIPGTDQFRFCGVSYDSFFVTTNGMIGLTLTNNSAKMDDFTTQSIPGTLAIQPGIFAFWKDFIFSAAIVTTNRVSYKTMVTASEGLVLVITYDRAPNFGATLATDYASFQVILQLAPAPAVDGRIICQYDDTRSGAEFLSKYFGLTLAGHTVGIQDVTGTLGIQYRRVTVTGPAGVLASGPLFTSPVAVAFGPSGGILPVELASFTSTVNRRDVTLNWTTTRENNNSGFDIERAILNGEWSKVGFVQGNGTSTSSINYSFVDRGLNSGNYNYRLKQIDFNGNFEYFNLSNEVGIGIPTKYDLAQNYPNPFNPTTKINYDIPFDGRVSIKIFDISGREVSTLVNEVQPAGYYTLNFNGSNLSSGAYFYKISADGNGQNFVATKKMMLIK